MTTSSFFFRLASITAATAAVLAVLFAALPEVQQHLAFAIAMMLLFILICTGLFYAGRSAAASTTKTAFINLVSASVFGKMVAAVAVLLVYQQAAQPTNQWFVGIFLFVYVVFTVFEVWFMTRLAKG